MAYHLVVTEGAELDMVEAYGYYERQQHGLGERFLSAVQSRFTQIAEHPGYYSYIDSRKILRDTIVEGFPYVVIFGVESETVAVYAVHLTHKNPISA